MITLVTIPNSEAPDVYREQYGEMLSKVRRYMNMDNAKFFWAYVTLTYTTDNLSLVAVYIYLDSDANIVDTSRD